MQLTESLELQSLHQKGRSGGTPGYCSPEQWFAFNKDEIDGRTDIYSLRVLFYEILPRRRPAPYDSSDPSTLEKNQKQQKITTSLPFLSKRTKVDPPSMYNLNVTKQLDACILKMSGSCYETKFNLGIDYRS